MNYRVQIETHANVNFSHGPYPTYGDALREATKVGKMSGVKLVNILDSTGRLIAKGDHTGVFLIPVPPPVPAFVGKAITTPAEKKEPMKTEQIKSSSTPYESAAKAMKETGDRIKEQLASMYKAVASKTENVKTSTPVASSTPNPKTVESSKENNMKKYVEETREEKRAGWSFIWLMMLGALLSSATWSGILFGPDAITSVQKWWNAPPELSELGEKLSEMLEDQDDWTLPYTDTVMHKEKGLRLSKGYSEVRLYDGGTDITDCLTKNDNSWLFRKVTPIIKNFSDLAKSKEVQTALDKASAAKAVLLKKLAEEKDAILKKLKK